MRQFYSLHFLIYLNLFLFLEKPQAVQVFKKVESVVESKPGK